MLNSLKEAFSLESFELLRSLISSPINLWLRPSQHPFLKRKENLQFDFFLFEGILQDQVTEDFCENLGGHAPYLINTFLI